MDTRTLMILLRCAEALCRCLGVSFPVAIAYATAVSEPEKLRWAAQEWRKGAKSVNATAEDLHSRVRALRDGWRGEAFEAFDDHMSRGAVQLRKLASDMEDVAHTLDAVAAKLQELKKLLERHLDRIIKIASRLIVAVLTKGAAGMNPALLQAVADMIGDILQATREQYAMCWKFERVLSAAGFEMPHIATVGGPIAKAVPEGDWGPVVPATGPDAGDTTPKPSEGTARRPAVSGSGGGGTGAPTSLAGFDPRPPGGFPSGYTQRAWDPLPTGYGWVSPGAPIPDGWAVDGRTRQLLPPGHAPEGTPPEQLLPGYTWIAPGTELPPGWRVDPATDVLVPPEDLAEPGALVTTGRPLPTDPAAGRASVVRDLG